MSLSDGTHRILVHIVVVLSKEPAYTRQHSDWYAAWNRLFQCPPKQHCSRLRTSSIFCTLLDSMTSVYLLDVVGLKYTDKDVHWGRPHLVSLQEIRITHGCALDDSVSVARHLARQWGLQSADWVGSIEHLGLQLYLQSLCNLFHSAGHYIIIQ